MAEGSDSYMGIAAILTGESKFVGDTAANDVITIEGASGQTADLLVCQTATPTEVFIVGSAGAVTMGSTLVLSGAGTLGSTVAVTGAVSLNSSNAIGKMVLGTVALASLASNASATVSVSGLTTACAVSIFPRAAVTTAIGVPVVWASDADKMGYASGGDSNTEAMTVNVWYFTTA